jgi:uncharacterized protein YjcR
MHYVAMRSHADIARALPAKEVAELCGVSIHTVRSWISRDSIPAEHWPAFRDRDLATLEDLVDARKTRGALTPKLPENLAA